MIFPSFSLSSRIAMSNSFIDERKNSVFFSEPNPQQKKNVGQNLFIHCVDIFASGINQE